ncbi:MAG: Holliday junction resolvase RuvX [Candidatus Marinimicrobia bacterium]|nr:Holliday junction resolvase RuvX [Candidatus Neomarinimicrobiota bacterium]
MSRTLGIDYGERRVGLAISDSMGIIAKPLTTLTNTANGSWWAALDEIIEDREVDTLVVGYPLNMKGQSTKQTEVVDHFITELGGRTGLPVERYDERLTSVAAKKSLIMQGVKTGHEKGRIDQTAAALLLQDYLDSRR